MAAPFNFSTTNIWSFSTRPATASTPSTDTLQTNWAGYSFALIALGNGGSSYARADSFRHNTNPHIPPSWLRLGTTPQQFSYNPNNNGSGTEFSLLSQRAFSKVSPRRRPSPTPSPFEPLDLQRVRDPSQQRRTLVLPRFDGRRRPDRSAVRLAEALHDRTVRSNLTTVFHASRPGRADRQHRDLQQPRFPDALPVTREISCTNRRSNVRTIRATVRWPDRPRAAKRTAVRSAASADEQSRMRSLRLRPSAVRQP